MADYDRILADNEMLTFKAMSRAVAEFFVDNEISSAVETLIAAKTFIRASKIGNYQQCTTMVRNLEDLIQTLDKIRERKLSSPKYSDIKQKSNYKPNKYRHSDDWLHTRVKYKRAKYYKHKNYWERVSSRFIFYSSSRKVNFIIFGKKVLWK